MITIVKEEMEARAPYNLLNSICAPRAITLISTINAQGIPNLAPFSYFNTFAGFPPNIMFSVSYRVMHQPREKDTLKNVVEVGEFVAHVVDENIAEAMIVTAADWPRGVNEFEMGNLKSVPSMEIKPLRVVSAPIAMECKVTQIIPAEGSTNVMVLGRVVRFHVREDLLRPNGLVNTVEMKPIARLGEPVEYTKIGELFHLKEPEIIKSKGENDSPP